MKAVGLLCSAALLLVAQVCLAAPTVGSATQTTQATKQFSIQGQQYAYYHRRRHSRDDRDRDRAGRVIRRALRGALFYDHRYHHRGESRYERRRWRYRYHHRGESRYERRRWRRGYNRRNWVLNPNGYRSFRQHSRDYCTYQPHGSAVRVETPCYGRP